MIWNYDNNFKIFLFTYDIFIPEDVHIVYILTSIVIYLQDDFLDLAGDESQHSADMALCLQTGASSVPPSLSSKDELRSSSEAATAAATSISSSTSETQLDNPSMKLENLDSWDQDV